MLKDLDQASYEQVVAALELLSERGPSWDALSWTPWRVHVTRT